MFSRPSTLNLTATGKIEEIPSDKKSWSKQERNRNWVKIESKFRIDKVDQILFFYKLFNQNIFAWQCNNTFKLTCNSFFRNSAYITLELGINNFFYKLKIFFYLINPHYEQTSADKDTESSDDSVSSFFGTTDRQRIAFFENSGQKDIGQSFSQKNPDSRQKSDTIYRKIRTKTRQTGHGHAVRRRLLMSFSSRQKKR